MEKNPLIISIVVTISLVSASFSFSEKVRFASHHKVTAYFVLPVLAALEKGRWKEQGLEVVWAPFGAAAQMVQAVAAGEIDLGTHGMDSVVIAASRGVPEVIVADPGMNVEFFFFVRADSPIKGPQDLKGAKIGASRFGGTPDRLARIVVKALGLEGQVKYVALGGGMPLIAAFRAGRVDVDITTFFAIAPLVVKGEVREILKVRDYVPSAIGAQVIFAHREFLSRDRQSARKGAEGFLKGASLVLRDRSWSIKKLITEFGFSEEVARGYLSRLSYAREGTLQKEKIQSVVDFVIGYGLASKEKVPPLETLYSHIY